MELIKEFNQRINNLKNEITNLKTAHFKTATTLSTMSKQGSISLDLKLYGTSYYEVISEKRAVITMTTSDDTNMIGAVYLLGVTPSNVDDRRIFCERLSSGSGQLKFAIYVYSQNETDFETLYDGGSVTLNYNIECVGTSRFTVDIKYEDFYKGW